MITKTKKEVNMVTVASIDELGSPSGDGAGGGEDNLGHISSVGHCCGHRCQQNNGNHYSSNVKVLIKMFDSQGTSWRTSQRGLVVVAKRAPPK